MGARGAFHLLLCHVANDSLIYFRAQYLYVIPENRSRPLFRMVEAGNTRFQPIHFPQVRA
jgi:hypothetical protein